MLDKLWDDVVGGPSPDPDSGLGRLRRLTTQNYNPVNEGERDAAKLHRSLSMPSSGSTPPSPGTPSSPMTPTSGSGQTENVWRSVFHPGSNLNTRNIGAQIFDKPSQPSSPTVYDWLYSDDSRSKHC